MDTRDGSILSADTVAALKKLGATSEAARDKMSHLKEMVLPLTPRQRKTMKVGRNDTCPCGSGKKFKKCCLEGVR